MEKSPKYKDDYKKFVDGFFKDGDAEETDATPKEGRSDPVNHTFILKGADVYLSVQENSVVKEDFEFFKENYTLLLKNVTEADSGVYQAEVTGSENRNIPAYNVTVQERVSPAVLKVTSVSSTPDSCNLTVTCGDGTLVINNTFRCTNQICYEEEAESSEVMTQTGSLHMYWSNGSITCNHSNQVSCSKDTAKIKPHCEGQNYRNSPYVLEIVVPVIVVGIVFAIILGYILYRKRTRVWVRETHPSHLTSQSESQNTRSTSDLFTTYSVVRRHTGPVSSAETSDNNNSRSIYAAIQKPKQMPNTTQT
ncbi:uncharacterized protein LOC130124396 [Lampris incognitus]|uniref:uncharacterized protein LOC130124396 n=1 Tax=Lampris incognitus TaxID=2546036 RepID=UPI0024B5FC99|nr:uncharacterized protein LOC130124396 [Lampris incognitus]